MKERRRRLWTSKAGSWPLRSFDPPPPEFFAAERPPLGDRTLGLALGDLRLEFEGLDEEMAIDGTKRYGPYADQGIASTGRALRVRVRAEDRDEFIVPSSTPEFNPVMLACDGERVRYLGYRIAGWFDTDDGEGLLLLARSGYEPALRAFENYVRAATAWQAASRGGALVHGAGLVRNGKGYLFFGESGAGKSTLAASTRRATVVSDDLSLCLPREGGGLDLVGSPFRGTYEEGEPVVGRFPLAAAFRLVQAPAAKVVPVSRVVAFGQLVGNLTFVAEAFDKRPDLFERVERAFSPIPLHHLHFTKDDTYWDAIDEAGL